MNSELADRIREYKTANPAVSYAEIARRFGISKTRTWNAINPERVRIHNRARRAYKREWDRAKRRSEAGRGHCEECGGLMGIDAKRKGFRVCMGCKRRTARLRRERIVNQWNRGVPVREIAAELGSTEKSIAVEIVRLRNLGYDLPYRHQPRQKSAAA